MNICDCRYEPILGPNYEWVGGNIIYCPRHAAAPELYEALKTIAHYPVLSKYPPIKWALDDMRQIARAALALADGDGGE